MSGIRNLLNIAKSAIFASQSSVNVASHNVANLNTEGYRKQEAQLSTRSGVQELFHVFGEGVNIDQIRQRQTKFADQRIYQESTRLGHWKSRTRIMEQIEALFTGVGESDLNAKMTDFFNAWEDLSTDPSSIEFRTQLEQRTRSLTAKFHDLNQGLNEIHENINGEIAGKVREVNEFLHKIHKLNDKIANLEYTGIMANDLRDQRNQLLRDLSGYMDIHVQERSHGRVEIIYDGMTLLNKDNVFELSTNTVSENDRKNTEISVHNKNLTIDSGEIGALYAVHEQMLTPYQEKLDELAREIVTQVNNYHELGFDLYGDLGSYFFEPGKIRAENIQLSDNIADDLKKVAAAGGTHDWMSGTHVSNGPGDNTTALKIAELQHVRVMEKNTTTFEGVYNKLYAEVGFDTAETKNNQKNHQLLVDQLDNYRESIVGVSLDEEMADILKFQNAYKAAAKLVSTGDEMFATLINMVR